MDLGKSELIHDVPPYIRVYKDGTIERLVPDEFAPASLHPPTKTCSKDILILPQTGVTVRIYLPNLSPTTQKLPLTLYFHGGAFCISSSHDPKYHLFLNKLSAKANTLIVSVNYRRAPEHPLPAAFNDSWAALHWVASHSSSNGPEPWLNNFVDFDKVFLSGDSAGATISNHLGLGVHLKLKLNGIILIHPYFWGEKPIGSEVMDPARKTMVDKWWNFVCPSEKGCDDPLINPFVDGAPSLAGLACGRVFICVAEMDILRDRGRFYFESLLKSGWKGKVEMLEIEGEDHVFHLFNPNAEKALNMINRFSSFINQ